MIQIPLFVSLLISVLSLVQGYRIGGYSEPTCWMLAFGAFWVLAQFRRWRWFTPIGLFAVLIAAGCGLWLDLPFGWMLAGALGALFAWDLAEFDRRLRASVPDDAPGLTRRHLLRVGLIALVGLAVSLTNMLIRWQASLEWAGYAAIVSATELALLLGKMQREEK